MARRRRYYFRKRHSRPETKKRPITTASKATYVVSIISMIVSVAAVGVAIATDSDILKIFAGLGFCFLLVGIYLLGRSVSRVKSDDEPFGARVMAVVLSAVALLPWVYLYIIGMINE